MSRQFPSPSFLRFCSPAVLRAIGLLGLILAVLCLSPGPAAAAENPPKCVFCCQPGNDLYRAVGGPTSGFPRFDSPAQAVEAAPDGSGVLILADGYPDKTTAIDAAVLDRAAAKKLRVYLEYPAALPGMALGKPLHSAVDRVVVASDFFGTDLQPLRILAVNGMRYLPAEAKRAHLVVARVAGFDTAVFGLPKNTSPLLFEYRDNVLVATTKLSHFVTGRYAPQEAWRAIFAAMFRWLQPGGPDVTLSWTPMVRPSYGRDAPLPADVEKEALRRGAEWFIRSKLLLHPSRVGGVGKAPPAYWYAAGMVPTPPPDAPVGDGTLGILEAPLSVIQSDGSQLQGVARRGDCHGESAMALAFGGKLLDDRQKLAIARNLLDFWYFTSDACKKERGDPRHGAYGLAAWGIDTPAWYKANYGDDNARLVLGTLAAAALLGEDRWDEPVLRCLLANLRTTGPLGFRGDRIDLRALAKGWKPFYQRRTVSYWPHMESYLWACYLWAYQQTGYEPFYQRAECAIRMTMAQYTDGWRWTNGLAQEKARMLLPLAWLVRVKDTPEHRAWLRKAVDGLVALQEPCGAIREELGLPAHGHFPPPRSNEAYGTAEASLIQQNGDPVCDLLYTTNFAFLGLHEAAAAGDRAAAEAEEKLAKFLCRVQVRSEAQPSLDGGWFRAFDYRRWEAWGSNADAGWGAWAIESGWTQGWITSILGLRQTRTSLWDLTKTSKINRHFPRLRDEMLPDAMLKALEPKKARHAAVDKPIALAAPPDARYSQDQLTAQMAPTPRSLPAVSLTLIPPSPVTDKIVLDIRAAIRNPGDAPRRYSAACFVDEERPENLVGRQTIEVAARSAAGIKFRWPTKDRAGDHTILLIVKAEDTARPLPQEEATWRASRPIKIIASDARSTRRLGGAWVDIYHHDERDGKPFNAELARMTDEDWRELVRAMHEVDQDIIVITMMFQNFTHRGQHKIETEGYQGKAYYPSKLYPGRMPIASEDPLEAILFEADKLGMHVLPGVGSYAFFDYTPGSLRWCKQVADELWQRYGHHPSFYGWYLSHEKDGGLGNAEERREIVEFFKEFTPYVHRLAPDKPVMLAPNCRHLRGTEETYRALLPNLDIICPFGYHRMPGGDMRGEEAAELMQSLCDAAGCHLWMDLESFVFGPGAVLLPRPIGGLVSDFTRFPNFEKTLHYQFPGLMSGPKMSRQPGGPASVKLYEDYARFLREGLPKPISHAALNKPVTLAAPPDPRYPGVGAAGLVNGRLALADYHDPQWLGFQGKNMEAVIDLGTPVELGSVAVRCLQETPSGIYLPKEVRVDVSEDGKTFKEVAVALPSLPLDAPGPEISVLKADVKAVARWLRVRAVSLGVVPAGHVAAGTKAWLFVDEVIVSGRTVAAENASKP